MTTPAAPPTMSQKQVQYGCIMVLTYSAGAITVLWAWCIVALIRQSPRRPLWGITLSFLIAIIVVNATYFGVVQKIDEVEMLETTGQLYPTDYKPGTPLCSERAISAGILSGISTSLNDGFLLYRSWMLFKRERIVLWFPTLLYVAAIITSLVSSLHCVYGASFQDPQAISTLSDIVFDVLTMVLNIILAFLISRRLQRAHKSHATSIHDIRTNGANTSRRYLNTIGIIIESAFAWTFFGILYTVARITSSPFKELLHTVFILTGALNPVVLILRILIDAHHCHAAPSGMSLHFLAQSSPPLTGACGVNGDVGISSDVESNGKA